MPLQIKKYSRNPLYELELLLYNVGYESVCWGGADMQCLKCGKETKSEQIFCDRCLASMEAYPVKPDVHIQLPKQTDRDLSKKSAKKRRAPSLEEQLVSLRRKNRRLIALLLVLVLLLGGAFYLLLHPHVSTEDADDGKNYTFEIPFG